MGWARHRGVLFQSEDYGQVIDALRKPSSRRDGIPWYVDERRRGPTIESHQRKTFPSPFSDAVVSGAPENLADVAAFAVKDHRRWACPCPRGSGRLRPGFSRGSSEWQNQEPAEGRNHESKRNREIIPWPRSTQPRNFVLISY